MKLTKKEAEKICELYNLGKLKSIKLFSEGLVNYNYELKSDKGSFVVRIIGSELHKYKRQKLELEKDKQSRMLIPFSAVIAMGDFMVIAEEDII